MNQLDVKSIVKRLIFLEYCISFIFTDFQLDGLQSNKPTDPKRVGLLRRKIENIDDSSSVPSEEDKKEQLNDMLEPFNSSKPFSIQNLLGSSKIANISTAAKV